MTVSTFDTEQFMRTIAFNGMLAHRNARKHTWRHYCCLQSFLNFTQRKSENDKFVTLFTDSNDRPSRVEFLGKTYFLTKYYTAGGWAIYYEHRQ